MATKLGPKSFSSVSDHMAPSAGLRSILRDQKIAPGTSRANVLLGLTHPPTASPSPPPSRTMPAPPADPSLDPTVISEDPDELKEEDVWATESLSWRDVAKPKDRGVPGMHRFPSRDNLVLSTEDFGLSREDFRIGKPRLNAIEPRPSSRCRAVLEKGPGLTDALGNVAVAGFSPLSRLSEGPGKVPSRLPTASWMIPQLGGAGEETPHRHMVQQSAPVNVPDWSLVVGAQAMTNKRIGALDDVDCDDDDERLPPHELLAREYARSQRSTFSVCEGQGRTLKGRDLSRVRNAVWSQLGFAD